LESVFNAIFLPQSRGQTNGAPYSDEEEAEEAPFARSSPVRRAQPHVQRGSPRKAPFRAKIDANEATSKPTATAPINKTAQRAQPSSPVKKVRINKKPYSVL